jgi:hypothetical protein
MKKLLLGAAAALAIAAPGVASAQSGYVDLGYASTEGDVLGVDFEGDGFTAGGAAAWSNFQLDGSFSSSDDVDSWQIGGHLFSRTDSYLFGGFANYGNSDPGGGADTGIWTVGLETQWYMDRTTFDGAISYSDAEDADATLTAIDLGLTHFATDNFSIGGNLGFGQLEGSGFDTDASTYGINAEYLFSSAPISVFGGWNHVTVDDDLLEADTLSVGIRYNWGGNLLERNRSGASLARGGGLGRYAGAL